MSPRCAAATNPGSSIVRSAQPNFSTPNEHGVEQQSQDRKSEVGNAGERLRPALHQGLPVVWGVAASARP
jgi:hypothetical protein